MYKKYLEDTVKLLYFGFKPSMDFLYKTYYFEKLQISTTF